MQKIILLGNKYKYWIFGVAILVAVCFRVWNFSGGMLLKGDQIRDAIMSARSIENGLGYLPLLGPRAGGTSLRLGPIFYYFQSISAFLVGSLRPSALALPNLLFSLLAIPMFFLVVYRYFSRNYSLFLTALFSFCFLAFEYSRFTWNPNSIPFFILLFLYAWLRIFSGESENNKKWFFILGTAFAVASQLHFTSLVALCLFLALNMVFIPKSLWVKTKWVNIAIFMGVIIFSYIPVIISDLMNNGDNLNLFFKSIESKTSDHSIFDNLSKEFYYFGQYYFRIAFGYLGHIKAWHYLGGFLFLGGIVLNVALLKKEKQQTKKDFLFAILLWTIVFCFLYFPLAYDIDMPRFFLPLIFLPYVHFGLLCQFSFKQKRIKNILLLILATLIFAGNFAGSFLWLKEFSQAQNGRLDAGDTIILKAKKDVSWWSWGMFEKATKIISNNCQGGAIYYYLPKRSMEFADTFEWAFKLNEEKRPVSFVKKIDLNKKGCVFAVTKQSYNLNENVVGDFEKIGSAGDMAIYKLERTQAEEEFILEIKNKSSEQEVPVAQAHQRVYWKDVFDKL